MKHVALNRPRIEHLTVRALGQEGRALPCSHSAGYVRWQLKYFTVLHMATNGQESAVSIDLGDTNTFQQGGKLQIRNLQVKRICCVSILMSSATCISFFFTALSRHRYSVIPAIGLTVIGAFFLGKGMYTFLKKKKSRFKLDLVFQRLENE